MFLITLERSFFPAVTPVLSTGLGMVLKLKSKVAFLLVAFTGFN